MFTGLISDVGRVRAVTQAGAGSDTRFEIATGYDTATIALGASISCSGCCLTAIETGPGWFAVQVSAETLSRTTLGGWQVGTPVNLERSLRMGEEIGGHLVSGHVDGVALAVAASPEGGSTRWRFRPPPALARYIAPKGSVAVNGVSLTVNEVDAEGFGVNIIPHTRDATTFGTLRPGEAVNLEVDMLARYVARILGKDA